MTPVQLSLRFFLELAVILAACRIVSKIARRLGQPPVVGEMIAGVLLGPSLFGYCAPVAQAWLFPVGTRPILFAAAQIGLVLYMFTVGLEFDQEQFRPQMRSAAAISLSGIAAPFLLGCAAAWPLLRSGGFFTAHVRPWQALPYLGACLAITAFPMLARIIFEQRLTGTRVGLLSLAAGAFGDAAAWGILAVVVASAEGNPRIAFTAIGGGALFMGLLFTVGRRMLGRLTERAQRGPEEERSALGTTLLLLILCGWFTDLIGLYAVFGAFFLGAAFPRGRFSERLRDLIEPVTSSLLVPLFFVYSGLNTRLDLVNKPVLWVAAAAILAAGVLGKAGACYAAARMGGEPHGNALAIGILMNARGLMELIILNIGLEHGIVTPVLFSILIFMGVATTLMATPLFQWAMAAEARRARLAMVGPETFP